MGVFAQTDFDITCKNQDVAIKVKTALQKMSKDGDEHGNFDFQEIEVDMDMVYGKHSSGRIQNLEWQCEQIWERIKDIKGVIEANFPFMSEADGCWFSNED